MVGGVPGKPGSMKIPPPSKASPPLIVRFSRVSDAPGNTWKTLSSSAASIIVAAALTPRIVSLPLMSRSPNTLSSSNRPERVSVYVPTPRTITSVPGDALLSITAARSVLLPAISRANPSPGFVSGVSRRLATALLTVHALLPPVSSKLESVSLMPEAVATSVRT